MTQVVDQPAAVEASTEATQPDGSQACECIWSLLNDDESSLLMSPSASVFFFGTLMLPAILTRVLGHPAPGVQYMDALLEGYVRHAVKGVDYPAACDAKASSTYLGR